MLQRPQVSTRGKAVLSGPVEFVIRVLLAVDQSLRPAEALRSWYADRYACKK